MNDRFPLLTLVLILLLVSSLITMCYATYKQYVYKEALKKTWEYYGITLDYCLDSQNLTIDEFNEEFREYLFEKIRNGENLP